MMWLDWAELNRPSVKVLVAARSVSSVVEVQEREEFWLTPVPGDFARAVQHRWCSLCTVGPHNAFRSMSFSSPRSVYLRASCS
jgi:hypothetical protein